MRWMQGKLELHKHVDFASNKVTIDILVLIEKPMIGGIDVLHEHLLYCFFIYLFTSIDLNHFKIYVETILLNILLTFVCLKLLFFVNSFLFCLYQVTWKKY